MIFQIKSRKNLLNHNSFINLERMIIETLMFIISIKGGTLCHRYHLDKIFNLIFIHLDLLVVILKSEFLNFINYNLKNICNGSFKERNLNNFTFNFF